MYVFLILLSVFCIIKYAKSRQKASEKAKATFTKALCKYECFTLSLVELIFAVFSPPIVMWADDSVLMLLKYLCSLPEANGNVPLDRVAFLR